MSRPDTDAAMETDCQIHLYTHMSRPDTDAESKRIAREAKVKAEQAAVSAGENP